MEKFTFDLEFSDDANARERRPQAKRTYRTKAVEQECAQARAEARRTRLEGLHDVVAHVAEPSGEVLYLRALPGRVSTFEHHEPSHRAHDGPAASSEIAPLAPDSGEVCGAGPLSESVACAEFGSNAGSIGSISCA